MKNITVVLFVLATEMIGSLPSIVNFKEIGGWYKDLVKPSFNPPDWVFSPAWTFLFALMGISSYLIYREGFIKESVRNALSIFVLQFALNLAWSHIFFGLHSPRFALVDIIILWLLIMITIFKFYKISKAAGLLLLPYLAWVTFAVVLNYSIVVLNNF